MASQQKELVEELNKHRIEIAQLKNSLNGIDNEKESWFSKKESCSKKIKEAIQKAREDKEKRDSLTKEVKGLKEKRGLANKEISAKLSELDRLKSEKSSLAKSLGIMESPSKIRQQIEKLEFRMQTEAISFDKEQSIMKKIKELKRAYEDSSILNECNEKIKNALDMLRKAKKEASESHKSIQEKARQSQVSHENILKISAEIDKIKVEEEDAFRRFSEIKKKFNEANSQLKEKLKAMNGIKNELDKISSDKKEKRKTEVESFLKSKEEEVNEKIRKKQKLTTEDLLVFQKFGKE